jgi:hypothetical protein
MWRAFLQSLENGEEAHDPEIPDPRTGPKDLVLRYQHFKDVLCRQFIEVCVTAIRKHDAGHMITIGCHPSTVPFQDGPPDRYFGFNPHTTADLLDYVSLHYYPYSDRMDIADWDENFRANMALCLASLRFMHAGKPLVLEEFGLYGGGIPPAFPWRKPFRFISQEHQADWTLGVMDESRGFCSGWLNWGFDDHPDWKDPTRYQGFFDDEGQPKALGKRFPAMAREIREWVATHPRTDGSRKLVYDSRLLMADTEANLRFKQDTITRFMETSDWDFQYR